MPVKLDSKLPDSPELRIEIIPLIDIMFFLLASFMLVSLSMVNLKSVKVNLPTSVSATPDRKNDFLDISIDQQGDLFLDKTPIAPHELAASLAAAKAANPDTRVFISADQDTRHANVIRALDAVRLAGIDKVAFDIQNPDPKAAP